MVDTTASLIGSVTQERATESNLGLQRTVARLTWVPFVLAAVTLLVTAMQAYTAFSAGGQDPATDRTGGTTRQDATQDRQGEGN